MNIVYENGAFSLSENERGAVVRLDPAVIVEDGVEQVLPLTECADGCLTYRHAGLEIRDTIQPLGNNGLFGITRRLLNHCARRRSIKSIFETETAFVPAHYVIPCVNYNGNVFGNQDTPTGLERDGKPWVFAYDREGIPSCTLSENHQFGVALFASSRDELSLRSSCSMLRTVRGGIRQRIFHPVTEAPYTYASKRIMREVYEEYLPIPPGGLVSLQMYLFVCVPRWENYACANLLDCVLDLFQPQKTPCLQLSRVWELGCAFSDQLLKDCHGHIMSYTNFAPRLFAYQHMVKITPARMAQLMQDPYYLILGQFGSRYEIGWADQGAMYARMRIVAGWKKSDRARMALGEQMLDDWAATQQENGLLYPQYQNNFPDDKTEKANPDACNMGWALCEFTRAYQFLQEHGRTKKNYHTFIQRLSRFACTHFSNTCGFGKRWKLSGEADQTDGSAGGFLIMGLLCANEVLDDPEILSVCIRAMDFYAKRDLDQFLCAAGALDCVSIDKETAYPFVNAGLRLWRLTGEPRFLRMAQQAAYYFCSWMDHYDCLYPDSSEFSRYGYYTTGGTAISVEHHAIDAWGAAIVPELMELWHITGDERWRTRAVLTWCNCLLDVASEEGVSIHGQVRPLGSQNEGHFCCRWTKYRPTCEERGHYNDCLSGWMGAFRMRTILSLREEDRKYFE